MTKRGVFITFEGGDGTGKSTQAKLLQQSFSAAGMDTILTREPGGTPQAERIRDLLLQRDSGAFDPLTEALLMFASRREHIVNKILPALEKGQWVISDRFADSTRAFQGAGMGLDAEKIEKLYHLVAGDFQPDLTLIFDLDPEVGLARSTKKAADTKTTEDRYERMGLAFHQRLREGFLQIAKKFPTRCVIIDAGQDTQTVHQQVLQVVEARLGASLKGCAHG